MTRSGAVTLALLTALLACGEDRPAAAPRVVRFGGASMGTTFSVQTVGLPADVAPERLRADVARLLDRLDQAMSTWREDSQLSRFNARRGKDWFPVTADTWRVAREAQRVAELSDGALDVTVGPLVQLWGFGARGRRSDLPTDAALAAARERVGWRQLLVHEAMPALRKTRADLSVDLSAVAKGHAVDLIAEHLEGLGVRRYLVEFGGELRGLGLAPDGAVWRVGIEQPDGAGGGPPLVLELSGGAVATSGDSRNAFVRGGRRYGHVIDPRSGWPVADELAAVSVVARSTLTADALATALFVLGPEQGWRLAEREGWAALFLLGNGRGGTRRWTPAFAAWLAGAPPES